MECVGVHMNTVFALVWQGGEEWENHLGTAPINICHCLLSSRTTPPVPPITLARPCELAQTGENQIDKSRYARKIKSVGLMWQNGEEWEKCSELRRSALVTVLCPALTPLPHKPLLGQVSMRHNYAVP
ncbi:hypothetical protein ElyMa_003682000 [Elysia marginata]|uniref:Uncharacterized protein n=1 Tax=Elysia marginata TaxID=1093978 RepID=A0AAV4EZF6_9GAST|nr:hypothetical protein ElyMa_003682000 [Elysia marginata]